ncbi:hypothetical protein [Chryseobacterium sp. 7]|uniref:hypothetical protein n=1 Tax=Chryseobacterium sp. 7 TaxID=2035214 RepID=UPI002938F1C4|nr:hypothetical protein [Chryseobacterium sp. 7]
MDTTFEEIQKMYDSKSLDTEVLLRWSKLLEYDFFRIYSQHLILYAPEEKRNYRSSGKKKSKLPVFRKNIYTREVIDFILEMINSGEMTRMMVIEKYKIPKTTLYKWIEKYNKTTPF